MSAPLTSSTFRPNILLVDDDADLLLLLAIRLTAAGFEVCTVESAEAALNSLEMFRPHLVITDMQMSGMDGMMLFEQIHRDRPTLPVIILTAHGTIPDAVAATQHGVFGYLTKPFDSKKFLDLVGQALGTFAGKMPQYASSNEVWHKAIVTQSASMIELLAKTKLVAQSDASVLIQGESGVGKELFAQAVHNASRRSQSPFIAVSCVAIPEQLLESELFGHVKGSFTGAIKDHKGLFQSAEGGTVFLDEIGDMPLSLQAKLLRVLQERQVRPIGSNQTIPLNVRIIAATHRDLKAEVISGRFREDVYYRLNVVQLDIPPLSDRREDIPLLANHFLTLLTKKYNKNVNGFSPGAMELLVRASWPGNVRQLFNIVEQSVVLCTTPLIPLTLLDDAIHKETECASSLEEAKKRFERNYLVRVLKISEGNVSQAARMAKRNRTEFYKLLQKHQLDPSVFKPALH